jgi:hypothetical protein
LVEPCIEGAGEGRGLEKCWPPTEPALRACGVEGSKARRGACSERLNWLFDCETGHVEKANTMKKSQEANTERRSRINRTLILLKFGTTTNPLFNRSSVSWPIT